MHIAIISDIHANFEALRELKDVLFSVDRVICLGDLVGYYCQVNEVIDFIRSLNPICVMGNHDYYLLNGCPKDSNAAVRFGIDYARKVISDQNLKWLSLLPSLWGGMIDRRSCLFVHGSPWNPFSDYLYENNPKLQRLEEFSFDVIAFGQTHRRLKNCNCNSLFLNPGSVGQSRDIQARACALVLDMQTMTLETIGYSYDANKVIDLAIKEGALEWVNKHLS